MPSREPGDGAEFVEGRILSGTRSRAMESGPIQDEWAPRTLEFKHPTRKVPRRFYSAGPGASFKIHGHVKKFGRFIPAASGSQIPAMGWLPFGGRRQTG